MLRSRISFLAAIILSMASFAGPVYAAHPLITDDTGTQGTGKFQLELNGEYAYDKEEPAAGMEIVTRDIEVAATLSYGVSESIDLVLGLPYAWSESRETDATVPSAVHASEKGLSDASFEVKWRFYERDGTSLGLKPGISIPTGSWRKGLGAGKYGASAFLIATQELKPIVLHLNFGYMRNNNRHEERENLCHLSLAAEYEATESLKIVANIGQERNPDPADKRKPRFALAGLILALGENLDLDAGVKIGLNDPEADLTVLAGMAARF